MACLPAPFSAPAQECPAVVDGRNGVIDVRGEEGLLVVVDVAGRHLAPVIRRESREHVDQDRRHGRNTQHGHNPELPQLPGAAAAHEAADHGLVKVHRRLSRVVVLAEDLNTVTPLLRIITRERQKCIKAGFALSGKDYF